MKRKANLIKTHARNERGSLSILMPLAILASIMGLGAFAADIAHNTAVRVQLQSATDAGALAGAAALIDPATAPLAASNASRVTGLNSADGVYVSTSTPNTTVDVVIDTNVPGEIGTCKVTASQPIQNFLGTIFGHNTDTISVSSIAAASRMVNKVAGNTLFPLAVSIDAVPGDKSGNQAPLGSLKPGDSVYLYINSQQVKNAAFTSFTVAPTNASWLNQAISQSLGLSAPQSNFIPPVQLGDPIYLDNGVSGQKKLASSSEFAALQAKNELTLPVIEGVPPFNQTRPVIGWVSIKVKSVLINQSGGEVETIVGTVTHAAVRGQKGDILSTGLGTNFDTSLQNMSPNSVRLIANVQGF